MRKSRFTEQQIIGFLKQAESGLPVKDVCRQGGFSEPTFYKWRAKYGGMEADEARRLKDLEVECIDPAVSAQVRLLKHKPQRESSCPAPDEGAGGYKSRSNLRSHDWRAAVSRSGGGARIGL